MIQCLCFFDSKGQKTHSNFNLFFNFSLYITQKISPCLPSSLTPSAIQLPVSSVSVPNYSSLSNISSGYQRLLHQSSIMSAPSHVPLRPDVSRRGSPTQENLKSSGTLADDMNLSNLSMTIISVDSYISTSTDPIQEESSEKSNVFATNQCASSNTRRRLQGPSNMKHKQYNSSSTISRCDTGSRTRLAQSESEIASTTVKKTPLSDNPKPYRFFPQERPSKHNSDYGSSFIFPRTSSEIRNWNDDINTFFVTDHSMTCRKFCRVFCKKVSRVCVAIRHWERPPDPFASDNDCASATCDPISCNEISSLSTASKMQSKKVEDKRRREWRRSQQLNSFSNRRRNKTKNCNAKNIYTT